MKEESCTCCGKKRSEVRMLNACPDDFYICNLCVGSLWAINQSADAAEPSLNPDLNALLLLDNLRQRKEISWLSYRIQVGRLKKRLNQYSKTPRS